MRAESVKIITLFNIFLLNSSFLHPHSIPRMLALQYLLLLMSGNIRVYLGCIDRAVSKHFLNVAYIHICLQQESCKGVAEHMGCYMLRDSGGVNVFVDHVTDRLLGEALI